MSAAEIRAEIKQMIVDELYLDGVTLESIDDEAPLFGGGLGLDSLDIVELVLLVKARFGVAIRNFEEGRRVFRSVNTLVEHIEAHRGGGSG